MGQKHILVNERFRKGRCLKLASFEKTGFSYLARKWHSNTFSEKLGILMGRTVAVSFKNHSEKLRLSCLRVESEGGGTEIIPLERARLYVGQAEKLSTSALRHSTKLNRAFGLGLAARFSTE